MDSVVCPNCNKSFTISDALKKHIEEEILESERIRHEKELKKQKEEIELKLSKKIEEDYKAKILEAEEEKEASKKRTEKLLEDLLKEKEEKRKLEEIQEEQKLLFQKELIEKERELKDKITKNITEAVNLEKLELQKQLDDTKKALEEAKRKADQKSQQLQGEIFELEIEKQLRNEFGDDDITPIGKGVTGADVLLKVKTKKGTHCGDILIESKRTKAWSEEWIEKLKKNLRELGAGSGIIVTTTLPKDMETDFGFRDGVYVTKYELLLPVVGIIRKKLIEVAYQKFVSENKEDKAGVLYEYITGHEFRLQIEALADIYKTQFAQIVKERAAFEKIWKSREEQAKKLLTSTASVYGTMQGIVGSSMPQIQGIDLLEDGE